MLRPRFELNIAFYYLMGMIDILVGGVLGLMILMLLARQTKNLCLNQTTYERFSKEHKETFAEEESYISSNKNKKIGQFSIRNCLMMCCEGKEKSGQEHKSVESLLI